MGVGLVYLRNVALVDYGSVIMGGEGRMGRSKHAAAWWWVETLETWDHALALSLN